MSDEPKVEETVEEAPDYPSVDEIVTKVLERVKPKIDALSEKIDKRTQEFSTEVKDAKGLAKDAKNTADNAVAKVNTCIQEVRVIGGKKIEEIGTTSSTPKKEKGGFGFFKDSD